MILEQECDFQLPRHVRFTYVDVEGFALFIRAEVKQIVPSDLQDQKNSENSEAL